MKIKSKDKGFNDMMSGGYGQMPHPVNMFGWLGDNVNPAWYMTGFKGSPVQMRSGGMGLGGGSSAPAPAAPTPATPSFSWSFPQYSQSWAFTPPTPTPYNPPPAFGSPAPRPPASGALTPFSLTELQKKYGK